MYRAVLQKSNIFRRINIVQVIIEDQFKDLFTISEWERYIYQKRPSLNITKGDQA